MTDILYIWLNQEVKLSKQITNFNEEFSNGYFFGELLYKYKLLPQFNQFKNSTEKSSITKNYLLLQYKLDELKINFTEKDKNEIINKKKYKAEMLLFRIREKLLSKLLQIEEIQDRTKGLKEINKIYKNVTRGKEPRTRLQSAKPTIFENIKEEINQKDSTKKNEKINKNKIDKKERLKSAKLPKLNKNIIKIGKNRAYVSGLESIALNNDLSKKENELFQQTLKDIEIYENIHMRNKMNIENLEKNNHIKEEKKEKNNLESWKKNYKKLRQFDEEKKVKNNQRINRLKSATQKSFSNTQRNYVSHIDNFDEKLERLGLNTKIDLVETKTNEISTENYMKSIIEAVKEKEKLRKQYKTRMKRIKESKENNENNKENTKDDFLYEDNKKRPQSSATTFMFLNNKNKWNTTSDNKNILTKFKERPFTARFDKINHKNDIIKKDYTRPKSGFSNIQINIKKEDEKGNLSKIEEKVPLFNLNKNSFLNDINQDFDKNMFFEHFDKENLNHFKRKAEKRHKEIICNRKIIKNIVNSLIDIANLCFDYKIEHNKKLVEMDEWNKIISNFISGNSLIVKKEKPKIKIEEDLDNSSYNLYLPIKQEILNDFGQYEYDELKNFIHLVGDKFDPEKNNLFVKKFNLGQEKPDINNIMNSDEIQILYEEAKKAGRILFDEDDERNEYGNHNNEKTIRYIPSKEEEELLEQIKDKYPSNYIFTNLISESIKFSYDKEPQTFIPKDTNNSRVIEEEINIPQQTDTENSQKKNVLNEGMSKISEENKNENNIKINTEEDKLVDIKELIKSIPIRISFLGVQKTEKKTRAKNMENKYNGLKVYNIKDFKKMLEENNKDINDENIIELLIKKIREDFQYKNFEDIKKDIIKKREELKNLNNELEKLREDQEKKGKLNVTKEMQTIQQQIEKINTDMIIGFILIGMPENISQSKLMDKKLMDFIQPCEQSITPFDSVYEKLNLICDQPPKEKIIEKNFTLSLNKIIHFESNKEVIFKKIDNRKKDPVKGDIYQMDLFPPKDKKILARLEDIIHPTHEEIETEIIKDENNYEFIDEYYSNLDVKCIKFKGYIINDNVNETINYKNYIQLLEQNALELDKQIEQEIINTLIMFEEKIAGPVNESVPLLDDIDNININESSAANKDKKDDLSQIPENSINQNTNINNANNKNSKIKDSLNSSMTFVKEISRINSTNNMNITHGELSTSQMYILPPSTLSEAELFKTYLIWKKMVYFYTNQYYKIFNREKKSGQKYIQRLNDIQKDFISYLSRPSQKNVIINQFLNKYKEFSKKCKSIENSKLVRDNYLKDINELNETLWKTVEIRKNESLEKIESSSQLIDQELNLCYNTIEKMAILETQKFIETINILLKFIQKNKTYQVNTSNVQPYIFILENPSAEILRKCDDCKLATYDAKRNKYNYPKATQIYKNCLRILLKVYYYLNKNVFKFHEKMMTSHQVKSRSPKKHKIKKPKKMLSKQVTIKSNVLGTSKLAETQNKLKSAIKTEMEKYKYISYHLYINSLETLSKIYCASKLVFKLMDNWVIDSMMYQNRAMNELFNKLKAISIEEIISNREILNKENIFQNLELDNFSKRYKLFNYNDFLFDEQTDRKKYLSAEELNQKEFGINIETILKLFTNWGTTSANIESNFGEIIQVIKNGEMQNGIITKNTFEKIFFINKIIDNNNKSIFPDFFYNFDFHNFHLFLSHFILKINEYNNTEEKNEIKEEEIEQDLNDEKLDNNYNDEKIIKEKYQELIHSNDVLTILFLICFDVISDEKIEIMKKENENKLINGKYINQENFINIKFWFEEKLTKTFKNNTDIIYKFKSFLFELNENNNQLVHFIHFTDLISLKSLKFKDEANKKEIKYYFDLFYN